MALSPAERTALIERYAEGPARLKAALSTVPEEALRWRPGRGEWSAHEVICHCADSETTAAARIRFLVAEKDPLIAGYDQEAWAVRLDYHRHPLELALTTVEAVRANTAVVIRSLPEDAWRSEGRHTESGRYTAEDWLRIYAEHLDIHARQIENNVVAWHAHARR